VITLPAIPVLFLAAFGAQDVPWIPRAIVAVAGYLVVRVIADGYYYITGREGLGLGDGKLLSVVGAVLGWRAIPIVIFMASFVGILISVPVLLAQKRARAQPVSATEGETTVRHTEVPFGPFLSLSAIVYLLFGDVLWNWVVDRVTGA
jgi:leader peptidase (prepilin peptidase)/N-methyltransferase